jgi:hypothetical protein
MAGLVCEGDGGFLRTTGVTSVARTGCFSASEGGACGEITDV